MNEWQPIETAPRDGTRILLYCAYTDAPDDERTRVGWWNWVDICGFGYEDDEHMPDPCFMDATTRAHNAEYGGYWDAPEYPATHWMPLPLDTPERIDRAEAPF